MAALGSSSSKTAPAVAQASPRVAAAQKAVGAPYHPPGVERGVGGKEKRFQQNRQFGPGPIKPYPGSRNMPPSQALPKPAAKANGTGPENLRRQGLVPGHVKARNAIGTGERVHTGDGVYRGWTGRVTGV